MTFPIDLEKYISHVPVTTNQISYRIPMVTNHQPMLNERGAGSATTPPRLPGAAGGPVPRDDAGLEATGRRGWRGEALRRLNEISSSSIL